MYKSLFAATGLLALSLFVGGCGSTGGGIIDQSSAEIAVQGFFDAMIAGDEDAALMYVDPSVASTEDFKETWEEISEWTFKRATVIGFEDPYVEIEMTIEYEGEEDSGTDEVEVKESDGKWWIVDLPS
jgi:hypothetical protein